MLSTRLIELFQVSVGKWEDGGKKENGPRSFANQRFNRSQTSEDGNSVSQEGELFF